VAPANVCARHPSQACDLHPARDGVQFATVQPRTGCEQQYVRPPYDCYLLLTLRNFSSKTVTDLVINGQVESDRKYVRRARIAMAIDGEWVASGRSYFNVKAPNLSPGQTATLEVLATTSDFRVNYAVRGVVLTLKTQINARRYGDPHYSTIPGWPCIALGDAESCS
jgi:hypothetical protein